MAKLADGLCFQMADFSFVFVVDLKAYGRLEEIHVQPLTLKKLRQTAKVPRVGNLWRGLQNIGIFRSIF